MQWAPGMSDLEQCLIYTGVQYMKSWNQLCQYCWAAAILSDLFSFKLFWRRSKWSAVHRDQTKSKKKHSLYSDVQEALTSQRQSRMCQHTPLRKKTTSLICSLPLWGHCEGVFVCLNHSTFSFDPQNYKLCRNEFVSPALKNIKSHYSRVFSCYYKLDFP